MPDLAPFTAFVSWPSAPLTDSLVRKALAALSAPPIIVDSQPEASTALLQWSTYDAIAHDLTLHAPSRVLASSYAIRKALIRKHFLARCTHAYTTKHPRSALKAAVPASWDIELSFADELEDMWADELYEVGQRMREGVWWILKPGMADRGMGIRLFETREELLRIFEGFDEEEELDEDEEGDGTAVATSQLRHFVVQEYIANPLLLDPAQIPLDGLAPRSSGDLRGHKFHLRAYCVASGALKLHLYTSVLALFSAVPYTAPHRTDDSQDIDLAPHLTNTSLQTHRGEEGVRLVDELVGCQILSGSAGVVTEADVQGMKDSMAEILAETFRAAMAMPVHFQALPNAFELYGVDFLVSDNAETSGFRVHLLEVNSEPAIELTGPRLTWILEDLFVAIGKVCVEPFFNPGKEEVDAAKYHLRKCLEMDVGYRQ